MIDKERIKAEAEAFFEWPSKDKTQAIEQWNTRYSAAQANDDKETMIMRIWEDSGHGTRREDIEAAYNAGVAACLAIARNIHAEANHVAHPDAEGWTAECVARIEQSNAGGKPLSETKSD